MLVPIKACKGGIVTVSEEAELGAPIVVITEVKVDPLFVRDSSMEVGTFDFVVARGRVDPFVVTTTGVMPKKTPCRRDLSHRRGLLNSESRYFSYVPNVSGFRTRGNAPIYGS